MKSFLSYINEARKNPEQNPKISSYEYLKPYSNRDDIYITFTTLQKVGINPLSGFNTPNGIYTYPLKEVWKEYDVDRYRSLEKLPFASDRPYISILKGKHSKSFIKNMKVDYSSKDFDDDMKKLLNICGDKQLMDDIIFQGIDNADRFHQNIIGNFWNITRLIAVYYKSQFKIKANTDTQAWNDILRRIGYTGFADKRGDRIIHPSEPIQAVFLTTSEFTVIDQIPNKNYTDVTAEFISNLFGIKFLSDPIKIELKKDNTTKYYKIIGGKIEIKNLLQDVTDTTLSISKATIINSNVVDISDIFLSDCVFEKCKLILSNDVITYRADVVECIIEDHRLIDIVTDFKLKNCKFKNSKLKLINVEMFSNIFNDYFDVTDLFPKLFELFEKTSSTKHILLDKIRAYQKNPHYYDQLKNSQEINKKIESEI